MEYQINENRALWGKLLFGIGVFALVVGVFLWVFMTALLVLQPESGLGLGEGLVVGGLCCFGPCGILGGLGVIIGRILWTSSRI